MIVHESATLKMGELPDERRPPFSGFFCYEISITSEKRV
ncbi:hypothetical protein MY7_3643 [Bacillus sp. 5B6]|nr:hypothetical protein MY7_3643 [Bacillus sp. 5B6]